MLVLGEPNKSVHQAVKRGQTNFLLNYVEQKLEFSWLLSPSLFTRAEITKPKAWLGKSMWLSVHNIERSVDYASTVQNILI